MKTSVQVLLGIIAGTVLALLLPINSIVLQIINETSTTIISMGRYIILPLLFFSMMVSVSQLQRSKLLAKNTFKLIGITSMFTLSMVIVGVISVLIYSSGQIPVVIDGIQNINIPSFKDIVALSFPNNIFSIFQGEFSSQNNQFIPFFILALILGIFFTRCSREEVEPTYNLVDSLSRIFFKINQYFYNLSFLWSLLLTASYITKIRNILDLSIFLPLIIMLIIISSIIIFVFFPVIFFFTSGKKNPFKYIFLEIPSLMTAILSGDLFFTGTAITLGQKKDFKIKRTYSGFNIPFLTLFSKGGTAFVSVITFVVILKSYSSLDITASQILWVSVFSFIISFCLPTKTIGSSISSLYILCSLYGYGGMEDSFIILSPAFPIIASIATLLNTASIILINTIMDPERNN